MDSLLRTAEPVLAEALEIWLAGDACALATVVATHGSTPRRPGAMLIVREDGSVVGSISGGCVEGALYESALEVLSTGVARIENYGPDGDLLAPGLTCGGSMSVLVERLDRASFPILGEICQRLVDGEGSAFRTTLSDDACRHTVVDPDGTPTGLLNNGDVLRVFTPAPRMVVVGSTDFAAEVSALGARMGYHVTACDARPVFTTAARLPGAHQVVCEWPSDYVARERDSGRFDARSVFVVLTHDPKIDVPVLIECLDDARWDVGPFYVGAMGSKRADTRRRRELLSAGLTNEQLIRLSSPIGLPIGNSGPVETAVSIAAELVTHEAQRRA
ncbi:XdhC family protein [Gordonia sp. CPCC 206044]|uniref:XdhC family protein n=1 Tax=Gordonia sp. CPCC 206044 TaxID=3140793 RepID=UPI003AF3AD35